MRVAAEFPETTRKITIEVSVVGQGRPPPALALVPGLVGLPECLVVALEARVVTLRLRVVRVERSEHHDRW